MLSRLFTTTHLLAAGAALALAALAPAQDLGFKAPPQEKPIWIVNATIHTISGPVIEKGALSFDRGLITGVYPSVPKIDTGSGAIVIDAAGKHVYPGLIGPDTTLGLTEIGAVRATNDLSETGSVTPEVRAAVAVNPDSTLIPVARSGGVLAAGVLPLGGLVPGRASVIRLEGWTWEDMAIAPDAGLVVNWPSMRIQRGWWVTRPEEEQEHEIKKNLGELDQAFDAAAGYLRARAGDAKTPVDIRWEAMRPALEGRAPVFIRAEELEQIQAAVLWAAGRGLKPVIVGARDAGGCLDLLKKHDVAVIVGGTHRMPKRDDSAYDEPFTLPARLHAAGIRFALASGEETAHERNLPYAAATAVAYGLDRDAAIRSITLSAAEILGVQASIGSIEKGKSATLIVTTGDPLEITTQIERAYIDGRDADLRNKQTILEAKYKEKYRQIRGSASNAPAASRPAPGGPGSGAAPNSGAAPSSPARSDSPR